MNMSEGLIGKKLGMTQVFAEDGSAVSVTVIEVEPSVVIQKKTKERDGYEAVQLGYGRIKQSRVTKPLQGHLQKAGKGLFRVLREIRVDKADRYEVGQELKADLFAPGEYVDVVGTTKGKGFAGVMKRHGFRGGAATHGSMFHRAPGSIGASADPSRVFKGTRMAGRLGGVRNTVQNLVVWSVRLDQNTLLVKGPVPGCRNAYVLLKKAVKKGNS